MQESGKQDPESEETFPWKPCEEEKAGAHGREPTLRGSSGIGQVLGRQRCVGAQASGSRLTHQALTFASALKR